MSKVIDPQNMSNFDRQYLKDRGFDPDEYAERFALVDEDEDGELEAEELEPAEGQEPGRLNQADDSGRPAYSEWDAKALQREIAQRNETRDEDSQIVLEGSGKEGRLRKSDLISALEADDELDNQDADDADDADGDDGDDS